jgi:uncharacterized protein
MVTDTTPWYRQPWPWFIISLPASAVIAGSITFYIAASGWDGPVAADYYRKGLAINEEITRSKLGQDLGVAAVLHFSGLHQGELVRVQLDADKPLPPEAALRVRLLHPGRKDADRLAVLSRLEVSTDGRSAVYTGQWQSELADERIAARPVAWQVVVETQQWRLDGGLDPAGSIDGFVLRALNR